MLFTQVGVAVVGAFENADAGGSGFFSARLKSTKLLISPRNDSTFDSGWGASISS